MAELEKYKRMRKSFEAHIGKEYIASFIWRCDKIIKFLEEREKKMKK